MMAVESYDLVYALATCSKETQKLLENNMSRRLFFLLLNDLSLDWAFMEKDIEDVKRVLKFLIKTAKAQ